MSTYRGHDLRTLADLTDRHRGRKIMFAGHSGTLIGLIPVADRIQCVLSVGGIRVFTDSLPKDTCVEVLRGLA